jgi:hypothetical protein
MVVADIRIHFGIDPTGRSARRRSGCEIVGEALQGVRMKRGTAAVVKVWERYGHAMPWYPGDLGESGRKLWHEVQGSEYAIQRTDRRSVKLLTDACRVVDQIDDRLVPYENQ